MIWPFIISTIGGISKNLFGPKQNLFLKHHRMIDRREQNQNPSNPQNNYRVLKGDKDYQGHQHCSQNITFDNRTNQDLNLTINYDTEAHQRNPTDVHSRIMIPKGTTMSHQLYSHPHSHSQRVQERKEYATTRVDRDKYSHLHQTPEPAKFQRQFRPLSHHPTQSHTAIRPVSNTNYIPYPHQVPIQPPPYRNQEQIVTVHPPIREIRYVSSPPPPHTTFIYPPTHIRTASPVNYRDKDSDSSSIKEELPSRTVVEAGLERVHRHCEAAVPPPVRFDLTGPSARLRTPSPVDKTERVLDTTITPSHPLRYYSPPHTHQYTRPVLPAGMDQSQRRRVESSRLSPEPQVYNYINTLYHKTLPTDERQYTFSEIKESQIKHRKPDDWRVEPIDPIQYYIKPASSKAEPKTIKKKLQESRDKRIRERTITQPINRHSVQKQYYHALPDKTYYQISHQRAAEESLKREELTKKRSPSCLRELQGRLSRTSRLKRDLGSYKKVHHSKHCTICHPYNASSRKTTSAKKRLMSPKAQQVTDRLFNRSKKKSQPCAHYLKLNEKSERQRFEELLKSNSFVSRYISNAQAEALFEKFRHDEESVSHWPMKIVNYTYDKLQKEEQIYKPHRT